MPTKLNPASEKDAISRRNTLFTAYVEKIFEALKKNGKDPVSLVGPLGPRSEIMMGLRQANESAVDTQMRIMASFAFYYPRIANSDAVDASI